MNMQEFERRFFDRELRYPRWQPLPSERAIHIQVESGYAATYAGQVAAITAASLFGRMSSCVAFDAPSIPVLPPLPWAGEQLDQIIMDTLRSGNRDGQYLQRYADNNDILLTVGSSGEGLVIHGCGWGAYCGSDASPLTDSAEINPFGPAFAAIVAVPQLQRQINDESVAPVVIDTYLWEAGIPGVDTPQVHTKFSPGELWWIGFGSVGSCALFFLSLVTSSFDAVLIDGDVVKVENVSRSALFSWEDALSKIAKVEAGSSWLKRIGVEHVAAHRDFLDEIPGQWDGRQPGTPDILISAANERNVRSFIENNYPPLQVYATTGRNWQATLFRHIPLHGACSLCVPGSDKPQSPPICATGSMPSDDSSSSKDDVALPFLSYAAGLATAAEIAKLTISREVVTRDSVVFDLDPRTDIMVLPVNLPLKDGCICTRRDVDLHKQIIQGSRFANLSEYHINTTA